MENKYDSFWSSNISDYFFCFNEKSTFVGYLMPYCRTVVLLFNPYLSVRIIPLLCEYSDKSLKVNNKDGCWLLFIAKVILKNYYHLDLAYIPT